MGIKVTEPKPGHLWLNCDQCGKPVSKTNEYGMFCEDMCGLEESKKGFDELRKVMEGMFPNEDFSFLDRK